MLSSVPCYPPSPGPLTCGRHHPSPSVLRPPPVTPLSLIPATAIASLYCPALLPLVSCLLDTVLPLCVLLSACQMAGNSDFNLTDANSGLQVFGVWLQMVRGALALPVRWVLVCGGSSVRLLPLVAGRVS